MKKSKQKSRKISVIGLGYVGMPIAVALKKKVDVIGFDTNEKKIQLYQSETRRMKSAMKKILNTAVFFTSDEAGIKNAKFHIIAVPTPINSDKTPDLSPVEDKVGLLAETL